MIRLRAQRLINPDFTDVKDVVAWMGAIQAQQPRMAKLALGIRTRGATMQHIKQALDHGEILRTHVLRPTWHYVSPNDIRWMLKLSCNRLKSAYASLMKGHGLTITEQMYDTANQHIYDMLSGGKSLTKQQITERIAEKGLPSDTIFMNRFLENAECEALICSGPEAGNTHTYMLLDERVAPMPLPTKDEALSKLARNYFRSHAPATLDDFCWWSGLSMKEARLGVEIIEKELQKVVFNDKTYLLHESSSSDIKEKESFIFLPAYDEYIIAYKYRGDVLEASNNSKAFTNNGVFFPLILQNGRATGNYLFDIKRKFPEIEVVINDFSEANIAFGEAQIQQQGLQNIRFTRLDCFNKDSYRQLNFEPNIVIISGIFELFGDNELVCKAISGALSALQTGGFLIYTGQPWHPQLKMIAFVLNSHQERDWVMRRRSQRELDSLFAFYGLTKCGMKLDNLGIFTVSYGTK